jgi:hypothetical protein
MRVTSRIESLSYGTLYLTGSVIALFLSISRNTPVEQLLFHTAASWGYVVYYVLHFY